MAKEDSSSEMELHDKFIEMVTPIGEPNFVSNTCLIQTVVISKVLVFCHYLIHRCVEVTLPFLFSWKEFICGKYE